MSPSNSCYLTLLVLSACPCVVEPSSGVSPVGQEKPSMRSGLNNVSKNVFGNEAKAGTNAQSSSFAAGTKSVFVENGFRRSSVNVFNQEKKRQNLVSRIRRSSNTATNNDETYSSLEDNSNPWKLFKLLFLKRTRKVNPQDRSTVERKSPSSQALNVSSRSDFGRNESQGKNQAYFNSDKDDLFLELTKRRNIPRWSSQITEETSTNGLESSQSHPRRVINSDNVPGYSAESSPTSFQHNGTFQTSSPDWTHGLEPDSHFEHNDTGALLNVVSDRQDNATSRISSSQESAAPARNGGNLGYDIGNLRSQIFAHEKYADINKDNDKINESTCSESMDYESNDKSNQTMDYILSDKTNHTTGAPLPNGVLKPPELYKGASKVARNFSHITEEGDQNAETRDDEEEDDDANLEESERINDLNNTDLNKCPACGNNTVTEEYMKIMRINKFKELLAQKLRLDPETLLRQEADFDSMIDERVPKLPPSVQEQTLRDNAREFEKDEFHARDLELIIAGQDMGRDCVKIYATGCYSFSLKGRVKGEVGEAKLWLYKVKDANDISGQTFNLYELERLKSGKLVQSNMIVSRDTLTEEGWINLNVTRSVVKWVGLRKGTKMLAIRCSTCATRGHRALFGTKHGYKPLLIIKYAMREHATRYRRSQTCDPRYECCKRDLSITFSDIGLPSIIQPRNLSVGYCFGECSEVHQYAYNHTAIKQLVRSSGTLTNPTMRHQLKPCCVPLILKDIFIMTSDANGFVVIKLLPKVIVERCGCV